MAWKNLTLHPSDAFLDDSHSILRVMGAAIVSAPAYSQALMTYKLSLSWHVLKPVHRSCHNKLCSSVALDTVDRVQL